MSWLICGTLPLDDYGIFEGHASYTAGSLCVGTTAIPVLRGSSALVAAATICCNVLHMPTPDVLLAGDCGKGKGSKQLYSHLVSTLSDRCLSGITFHYLLPDVDWQCRILMAVESLKQKPLLIADAGYMYAVKMSGSAPAFDLFTPDAGELAFLADEEASHPFYTQGFLLDDGQPVDGLINRAVKNAGAAKHLLVKGATDYVVIDGVITDTISHPNVEAMEAIGGTGDTITGIVSALLSSSFSFRRALVTAALTNRIMAQCAEPTPATQVSELLGFLPEALSVAITQTDDLDK